MILLITPHARAQECAGEFERVTGEQTRLVENLHQATLRLRGEEFSAVVFDQSLVESNTDESETTFQHLGTAIPIYVNFGISSRDRVVREVKAALTRRKREETLARQAVEQRLRSDLKSLVTAMLLSCELALEAENLPARFAERVCSIHDLAKQLRARLGLEGPS